MHACVSEWVCAEREKKKKENEIEKWQSVEEESYTIETYPFDRPLVCWKLGLPFSDELISRCCRCTLRPVLWFDVRPFSLILFASTRLNPFILFERGTPPRAGDIDTNLRDIEWICLPVSIEFDLVGMTVGLHQVQYLIIGRRCRRCRCPIW